LVVFRLGHDGIHHVVKLALRPCEKCGRDRLIFDRFLWLWTEDTTAGLCTTATLLYVLLREWTAQVSLYH
jgi:hypothetical protein